MRDFAEKVHEVQRIMLARGLNYNTETICKMAAAMPAPRFYINPREALHQYNLYVKGESHILRDANRRMFAEIFARFENLLAIRQSYGQVVNKYEIMSEVVEQEAPCFYYNENRAAKRYYYYMANKKYLRR